MSRLQDLDNGALGRSSSSGREAWGRKHGWSLFLLLGLLLLAVCAWALAADRPAIAGINIGFGAAFVALGLFLFVKREQ